MSDNELYENWQLSRFGNIVKESDSRLETMFGNEEDTKLNTSEESYLFSLTEQNF